MASDLAESHISQLLEAAVEAARIAGPYFISGFRDRSALADSIETKSSATDLVTASDKLCEKVIVEHLSAKFPNHAFIGEEGTGGTWPEDDTPVWIIDPIDGTTNFVSGLEPFTCISIGCAIRKQPVVGVVYAPLVDQLYSAALGRGAFLNGTTKLPIFDHFPPLSLSSALVVTEFGHSPAPEIQKPKQEAIARLVGNCRGIRSFGSCAMNMCTVSKGGCDAYYEKGIHCWVGFDGNTSTGVVLSV